MGVITIFQKLAIVVVFLDLLFFITMSVIYYLAASSLGSNAIAYAVISALFVIPCILAIVGYCVERHKFYLPYLGCTVSTAVTVSVWGRRGFRGREREGCWQRPLPFKNLTSRWVDSHPSSQIPRLFPELFIVLPELFSDSIKQEIATSAGAFLNIPELQECEYCLWGLHTAGLHYSTRL